MVYPVANIYDMGDENSMARIELRLTALIGVVPTRWKTFHTLEAKGGIVDACDAVLGKRAAVMCGIAGREKSKTGENGHTFVYGLIGETLVVCTTPMLGLLLKVKPELTLRKIDLPRFIESCRTDTKRRVFQFRTFDAIPWWIKAYFEREDLNALSVPYEPAPMALSSCVWQIDRRDDEPFNLKLTNLSEDIERFEPGREAEIRIIKCRGRKTTTWKKIVQCCSTLDEVDRGKPGIYVGSSGLEENRFLEFAYNGKSAARITGAKVGDHVSIKMI